MTGHDKKHFDQKTIEKILELRFPNKSDKRRWTYQELVNRFGGSISGMQKICARGDNV